MLVRACEKRGGMWNVEKITSLLFGFVRQKGETFFGTLFSRWGNFFCKLFLLHFDFLTFWLLDLGTILMYFECYFIVQSTVWNCKLFKIMARSIIMHNLKRTNECTGWSLKDWMILNKNDSYKHRFFKFFIILFGNIINGFSVFQWPPYIYIIQTNQKIRKIFIEQWVLPPIVSCIIQQLQHFKF